MGFDLQRCLINALSEHELVTELVLLSFVNSTDRLVHVFVEHFNVLVCEQRVATLRVKLVRVSFFS